MKTILFFSAAKNMLLLVFLLVTMGFNTNAQVTVVQIGNDIDGEDSADYSGRAVSVNADGSVIAIGAPFHNGNGNFAGQVRVFNNSGGIWTQMGADIDGEYEGDRFGYSVSLSADGTVLAAGAPYYTDSLGHEGVIRIYRYIGNTWIKKGNIVSENILDLSGYSLSLNADGSVVAVSAPRTVADVGQVRIYKDSSGYWTQLGNSIDGEAADDWSGYSVSLNANGTTVAIGAIGNDGNGTDAGHTRVFHLSGGLWVQKGGDIDGDAAGDQSGLSVSISADGSVVATGAILNSDSLFEAGQVRVYQFSAGNWVQMGSNIYGYATGEASGQSIDLNADGSVVAIGVIGGNHHGDYTGLIRMYKYSAGNWSQIVNDIDGEADNNLFGYSVSVSDDGSVVAGGAPQNDGSATDAGHARVYRLVGLGINGHEVSPAFDISPNPVNDFLKINFCQPDKATIEIFDIQGRKVIQGMSEGNSTYINTGELNSGIYLIKYTGNTIISFEKFIKE